MSHHIHRPAPGEKGLPTPGNRVVTVIDLQPQMRFDVSNFDRRMR
jgi:hypothetical protein